MRRFEVREVRPRKFAQLSLVGLRALPENNKGVRGLAPALMRLPNDGHLLTEFTVSLCCATFCKIHRLSPRFLPESPLRNVPSISTALQTPAHAVAGLCL